MTDPRKPARRDRGLRALWSRLKARARTLPPGLRLVLGLLVMVGGVFGMLPVLGFWMIPVGAAIAWMDIRPIWKKLRGK